MKKAILFTLPLAMLVAACGGGNQGINKGDIFTAEFMEANKSIMLSSDPYVAKYEIGIDEKVSLGSNVDVSVDGTNPGLVNITNSDSKVAKYSLAVNKIIAPFGHSDFSSSTVSVQEMNFKVYRFSTSDGLNSTHYMTDEFGNELYRGSASIGNPNVSIINKDDRKSAQEYVRVLVTSEGSIKEFVYNVDGTISRSGDYAPKYGVGEILGQAQDTLKDYGHEDLVLITNNVGTADRYVIRDVKANKYVTSFEVPRDVKKYIAGDYLIYQYKVELEERATSYTYFEVDGAGAQHKYNLETYRINYMSGAKEKLDRKFVITDSKEFYSSDKVKRFCLVDVRAIREDRSLEPDTKSYFVNDNCDTVADVSGVGFKDLIVSNGKYISKNGVVYNEKLEEVNYIPGLDSTKDKDCHIYKENNFYGICDYDGKVLEAATNSSADRLLQGLYTLNDSSSYRTVKLEGNSVLSVVGSFKHSAYQMSDEHVEGTVHTIKLSDQGVKYSYNKISGLVLPRITTTDTEFATVDETTFFGETGHVYAKIYQTGTNDFYAIRSFERSVYAIPEI